MNTPSPKYFCPRCKTAFAVDTNFCGKCGADMHRASSLLYRRDEQAPTFEMPSVGTEDDEWIGRVIDSRYRVLQCIGQGGMGVVYKIEHQRMGKIAAMKVLHRELAADRNVVRRFRREASAVSRLTHPNTVQVFDFGMSGGALYLVMEYVGGQDLGQVLDREGPMSFVAIAPWFHQICSALAEAHDLGIVHRDLKPENVLVTRTRDGADFIKVLDFGLAKLTEREEAAQVTERGSIVGTPYYMSPEQIRAEDIDQRSDIYSLGAVMYRALTGEPPYRAPTPVGVLTKHLTAELVPPSEKRADLKIDPSVDAIVVRAMHKIRSERFATTRELRTALELAYTELTGDSSVAFSPSGSSIRRPSSQRAQAESSGAGQAPKRHSATAVELEHDIEPGKRLRREDLDAFESSLRRGRVLRLVSIPVVVALIVAGGYYWVGSSQRSAASHEREPNNEPDQATLIASGSTVTGYLGSRISRTESDRDCFRLREQPAADGSEKISATLKALPNVDMAVHVHRGDGAFIATADNGPVGADEVIRGLRVSSPIIVVVAESGTGAGGLPTENVSDRYELTVTLSKARPGEELEPNDTPANATVLEPDTEIEGYFDRRRDIDTYRFSGPRGRYTVSLTGAAQEPLRLRRGTGPASSARALTAELAPGEILRVERDESGGGARLAVGKGPAYRLTVRAAK